MRKSIGLAALAVALMSSGATLGADINGRDSLKDMPADFSSPGVVNWTGFYVGVQGGNANHNLSVNEYFKDYCGDDGQEDQYGFARDFGEFGSPGDVDNRSKYLVDNALVCGTKNVGTAQDPVISKTFDVTPVPGDNREIGSIDGVNSHGFIGGGRIGFDYARGRLLFGAFADYNFSGMETNVNVVGIGAFDLKKEDEWTIGGRIGYIVAPRTLAYVLAGYTQTEYSVGGLDNAVIAPLFTSVKSGATFDGVTVGGGIEFALAANVFFGLEYQHTFYGEETLIDAYNADYNQGVKVLDDLDEDKIMATLKIKFNGLTD